MRALTISAFLVLGTAALAACRADYPPGSAVDPHYADPRYAPPAVQAPAYAPALAAPNVAPPQAASGPPINITRPPSP